jgi:hypothetical protein
VSNDQPPADEEQRRTPLFDCVEMSAVTMPHTKTQRG